MAAVFPFPLQVGEARLGALNGTGPERVHSGLLGSPKIRPSPRATLSVLLGGQERAASGALAPFERRLQPELEDAFDGQFQVYQAHGMVRVQFGVSLKEALARLRGYAFAHDRPLTIVAADVLGRRLPFRPDS